MRDLRSEMQDRILTASEWEDILLDTMPEELRGQPGAAALWIVTISMQPDMEWITDQMRKVAELFDGTEIGNAIDASIHKLDSKAPLGVHDAMALFEGQAVLVALQNPIRLVAAGMWPHGTVLTHALMLVYRYPELFAAAIAECMSHMERDTGQEHKGVTNP